MTSHFEEQLHSQRLRATSQAQAEREAEADGRRREVARLEEEVCGPPPRDPMWPRVTPCDPI
eukprot:1031305-Prymnesium_polylepis.1